jgi:hypothetical protein
MTDGEGLLSRMYRLFSRRVPAADEKAKPDVDIVDPFERFEIAIRRASEGSEE